MTQVSIKPLEADVPGQGFSRTIINIIKPSDIYITVLFINLKTPISEFFNSFPTTNIVQL